jgi:hypothetical protein
MIGGGGGVYDTEDGGGSLQIWLRAPSNRSSSDAVAVCLHNTPLSVSLDPLSCVVVLHTSEAGGGGGRGPATPIWRVRVSRGQLGPTFSQAGKYQLRYLGAVNSGGGGGGGGGGGEVEMHAVQAVSQFEIRNTQEWCHGVSLRVETAQPVMCLGAHVEINVTVPTALEEVHVRSLVLALVPAPPDMGLGTDVIAAYGSIADLPIVGQTCPTCVTPICQQRGGGGGGDTGPPPRCQVKE